MKKSKHFTKRFIPLFAVLSTTLLLSSCNNKGKDDEKYDEFGISDDMEGAEVLDALHQNALEKHRKYVTYSSYQDYQYNSATDYQKKTSIDAYGKDRTKTICFYTGKLQATYSGMNREHVWACANSANLWTHNSADGSHYVDGSGYKGGGSDLYHVRATLGDVNTRRGNSKLYEFKEGETKYQFPEYSVPYYIQTDKDGDFATRFEPADEIKGDMVRIICYVYMHYANIGDNSEVSDTVRSYLGALNYRDIFNSSYTLQDIHEIIVRWNKLDPVDETEKLRNDTVEKIQGNRNPFVDHPEYLDRIYGSEEE